MPRTRDRRWRPSDENGKEPRETLAPLRLLQNDAGGAVPSSPHTSAGAAADCAAAAEPTQRARMRDDETEEETKDGMVVAIGAESALSVAVGGNDESSANDVTVQAAVGQVAAAKALIRGLEGRVALGWEEASRLVAAGHRSGGCLTPSSSQRVGSGRSASRASGADAPSGAADAAPTLGMLVAVDERSVG